MAGTLQIQNVNKQFTNPQGETITALSNVNLTIEAGSFVSLIGPSGCGKCRIIPLKDCLLTFLMPGTSACSR